MHMWSNSCSTPGANMAERQYSWLRKVSVLARMAISLGGPDNRCASTITLPPDTQSNSALSVTKPAGQYTVQHTARLHHKLIQESLAIAKTTARCAQYMGALKSFESPRKRPRLLFPKFVKGFFPIDTKNVHTNFEVRSFTHT